MEKVKNRKYSAYKPTSVEWLGEIPEHWGLRKIKYLFQEINERSLKGEENLLSVSQYTGVTLKSDKLEEGDLLTNASTLEGYKKVYKGDLVSNIMLAWNGSLGFSPYDGITSPAYSIYRLSEDNSERYFHYLLRTELYQSEFKRNSSGVIESRLRLYTDDFFKIPSILPPFPEQIAIATFLDRKTALIDKAIGIKEKQIELLKERRQILIHNAVTHGLHSNVKMKYSDLECIGDIPAHWGIADLRRFTAEHRQGYYSEKGYDESGHKVVRITDLLENNIIDINESPYYTINKENQERYELRKGDFLFQRTGSHKKIGVFNSDEPTIYASFLIRFRFNEKINHKFLLCVLNSQVYTLQLNAQIHGGVNPNIHAENIKICKIVLPSIEEQTEIANYSETITKKISTAINLKEQEIEKLKEYKATLINSAVTGKIKVC